MREKKRYRTAIGKLWFLYIFEIDKRAIFVAEYMIFLYKTIIYLKT